ncbi:MAG: NAD(P)-dependent alcohol dehydrogenase [Candidatus Latescibacteria bacterium]|jgi:L-iditol 2-dehydrogenase|nr:NAD(P)-dependent alcohol dehydrogenase [Candidatus Latescibacterota bacterium]
MNDLRDVAMGDIPDPVIKPHEALVQVRSVGVCGSDIHYYAHGRIGGYIVEPPFILGHECAGEVVALGSLVSGLSVGDRVAVEPGVPCRRCEFCAGGRYNLCPDVVFLATPPMQGAFCEYISHDAEFLFKLPDEMNFADGAMLEPLSTGIQAVKRSGMTVGDCVFIYGMGPIGLSTLQAFLAAGAGKVYVGDMRTKRLEMALELGTCEAFDVSQVDVVGEIRERSAGLGPHIVVETAGAKQSTLETVEMARRGGTVVLVGLAPDPTVPMNMLAPIDKELDVRGVFRYCHTYPTAIALVERGAAELRSMVTHQYDLEATPMALEDSVDPSPDRIKAIVNLDG